MGFSKQEYLSGLPFPSPGDPPDLGIELRSPPLQADSFFFFFRQILYCLSHLGSPQSAEEKVKKR